MRILLLSNLFFPNEIGGYEIGCRDYTSLLDKMGHETLIATSFFEDNPIKDNKSIKRLFKMFVNFGYDKKIFTYEECERYNPLVLKTLIDDWKPEKILIWNIQGLGTNLLNTIIESKISFNIFCWDYSYFYYQKKIKDYLLFRSKNKVSNSQYSLIKKKMFFASKYFQNYYGVNLNENKVLYPFIEFDRFNYNPNFSSKKNKLVYLGQIVEHKGIFDIIPLIEKYNKQNNERLNLTIYSQNINKKNYEYLRKFNFINIKENIKREQIQKELPLYDIGLFPSKWKEPFGISCLEMLASGLIVLSTCSGGSVEMVINKNPIKFDIFKKNDFFSKLEEIMKYENNKSDWNKEGVKKFDKSSIINQLNQIISNGN